MTIHDNLNYDENVLKLTDWLEGKPETKVFAGDWQDKVGGQMQVQNNLTTYLPRLEDFEFANSQYSNTKERLRFGLSWLDISSAVHTKNKQKIWKTHFFDDLFPIFSHVFSIFATNFHFSFFSNSVRHLRGHPNQGFWIDFSQATHFRAPQAFSLQNSTKRRLKTPLKMKLDEYRIAKDYTWKKKIWIIFCTMKQFTQHRKNWYMYDECIHVTYDVQLMFWSVVNSKFLGPNCPASNWPSYKHNCINSVHQNTNWIVNIISCIPIILSLSVPSLLLIHILLFSSCIIFHVFSRLLRLHPLLNSGINDASIVFVTTSTPPTVQNWQPRHHPTPPARCWLSMCPNASAPWTRAKGTGKGRSKFGKVKKHKNATFIYLKYIKIYIYIC